MVGATFVRDHGHHPDYWISREARLAPFVILRPAHLRRALGLIALVSSAAYGDARVQLSLGTQYSDGDYGETVGTRAWVVPFSARLSAGSWSFQASVPYVRVQGPEFLPEIIDASGGRGSNSGSGGNGSGSSGSSGDGSSGSGGDDGTPPVTNPPPAGTPREVSGLGDSSLSATYSIDRIGATPIYLDVTGRIRFPTGSESQGLGVGATDYLTLGELGFSGLRAGAFVSGGRRFLGNTGTSLRVDGWQAGAGAWVALGPHTTLGVNYDWREASVRNGIAPAFAESFVAWRLSDVWKVEINAGAGLSKASADFAAGFTITWRGRAQRHGG